MICKMLRNKNKGQVGFTLVELAISMGIIGLLVGGVLKGAQMVENAKTKALYNDFNSYSAAILTYADTHNQMLPGDENDPTQPPGDTYNGNGDGAVVGNGAEAEAWNVFEDLENAGLIASRKTDGNIYPVNAYGGKLYFHTHNANTPGTTNYTYAHRFVYTSIPIKAIKQLDHQYDDGVYNTGDIVSDIAYGKWNSDELAEMSIKF